MEAGQEGEPAGLVVPTRTKAKQEAETPNGPGPKPAEEFTYAALVHRSADSVKLSQ